MRSRPFLFYLTTALAMAGTAVAETDAKPGRREMTVTEKDRQHWAFLPLRPVTVPVAKDAAWARTPVDHFIRQAQEAAGLTASEAADARTLVRRIYFDLIGLPPAPEEMAEWSGRITKSSAEVAALVEALLASPHYGERWGRHWLDVARYADSNGLEGDHDRPNAYHYRDFVIRALNSDMPADQFMRWQLAGDELAPGNKEAIAATGFIVAGTSTTISVPMQEELLRIRANELDDMVSTTGQAMLGLTLACARCHDHLYDPLPTRDYYRLMSIFNSGDRKQVPLAAPDAVKSHKAAMQAWQQESDAAAKARDAWLAQNRASLVDKAQGEKLTARVKELQNSKPSPLPTTYAFADFAPEPRESWVFERGDFMARNEKAALGFLTVLLHDKPAEAYWQAARAAKTRDDSTQQRRALAEWITDLDQGAGRLLARVLVNRVWQHHFGHGLVRSVNDFGTRGEKPTHPDLLEWLTRDFIAHGWSLKHLHRLMVNSATYQQVSSHDAAKAAVDPENKLLWRRKPLRLESEILRDSMLATAGTLNRSLYGPAFKPPIQAEALQARNVKDPYPTDARDTPETRRRTIYMFHKRVVQYPLLQAFDAPDSQQSCGSRMNTTVAPQALAMLNDPFVRLRAAEFAEKVHKTAGDDPAKQIRQIFEHGLSRQPSPEELTEATAFLSAQTAARQQRDGKVSATEARLQALADFCQTLFGLNEFIYID